MSFSRELSVGLSVAASGTLARQGRQALDGARLWASYINQAGGVAITPTERRPVRLIWLDDESRIERARQNVLHLLNEDIDLLLGPYGSAITLAVVEVAERHRRILWNCGGSSDEIFRRRLRYVVSVISQASDYLRDLPRWLAANCHLCRRITVVHSASGSFGAEVARGLAEAAAAVAGFTIDIVRYAPRAPLGALDDIRRLAPDVLVLAGRFEDDVLLVRARTQWPVSVRETVAVAAGVAAFGQELGADADAVIGCSQWEPDNAAGAIGTPARKVRAPGTPPVYGPDSQWFVRSFREQFGEILEYTAAATFAAGLIASECIKQAQSLDADRLRPVAATLDLQTFFGRFRIDPNSGGQLGHRVRLVRWHGGRKIPIDVAPL